jgi:hypothetical protein
MGNNISNNIWNNISNNNEYICNKITSKTKMINNDLTLYNNNLDSIKIIKIKKKDEYKFVINENIYKNYDINNDINNDFIINLTIILNEYISNNFLIFDEEIPLINIEEIEKYIIKQCK